MSYKQLEIIGDSMWTIKISVDVDMTVAYKQTIVCKATLLDSDLGAYLE